MKNHTILPKPKWQSFCKCQRERRTKETNKYCNSFPFCSQTNWYLFIFLKIVTKIRLTYISSECVRVPIEINTPANIYIFPSFSLPHSHLHLSTPAGSESCNFGSHGNPTEGKREQTKREKERAPAFNVNATAGERGRALSLALRKWEGESALKKEVHIMLDNFRTKELLKLCQRSKKNTPATTLHQFMAGELHL